MIDHASILSVNDESMLLALLNMLHKGRLHFSYLNTIQFDMASCKWLVQAQTQIKRTLTPHYNNPPEKSVLTHQCQVWAPWW